LQPAAFKQTYFKCRVIILSDIYRLPFPVSLTVVLKQDNYLQTAYTRQFDGYTKCSDNTVHNVCTNRNTGFVEVCK
jgi:hypothetical protein